jgi:aminoglycoside 3-N-acetyltransferase
MTAAHRTAEAEPGSAPAVTADKVVDDLYALGLRRGDTLLVRAAARSVGFAGDHARRLLGALLAAIGPDGTLLGYAHTGDQYVWKRTTDRVFHSGAPNITGGLAAAMLAHEGAVRSRHPTNSWVGIGPAAHDILAGHDETALCFAPVARLVELGAKDAVIGNVRTSPGLGTLHFAQEELGLARRTLVSGLIGAYYHDRDGAVRWYRKVDEPGCSLGFWKAYGHYVNAEVLHAGPVGRTYAILAEAARTLPVDVELLRRDPASVLCDDPGCPRCGVVTYAPGRLPRFVVARVTRLLRGRASRGAQSSPREPSTGR